MIKFLSKQNFREWKGKVALVRIDLNVLGKTDNFRLEASLPTIKLLLKNKIRVVLLGHRGRPVLKSEKLLKGLKGDWDFNKTNRALSLKLFVQVFTKKLKTSVRFIPYEHSWLTKPKEFIYKQKEKIFLFENLRFYRGEEINDWRFGQFLSDWGDFYINDAFAVSHRANASVAAITKFLPSYAGLLMEKEIKNLDRVRDSAKKPFTIIIGGAKIGEKLRVIEYFWSAPPAGGRRKADHFLLGGGPGITFFAAKKFPIGDSICDKDAIPKIKKYIDSPKIILPSDVLMHEERIMDIGPQTLREWGNIIKNSKTIIWNGPVGYIEDKKFARGSKELLRITSKARAFTVLGGGELTGLIHKMGFDKKFSFVSTGGGAMLSYLSGKELPGIKALQ